MKKLLIAISTLTPGFAFAQAAASTANFSNLNTAANGLKGFVQNVTGAINSVIPFMIALAVIVFIYGVIKYIIVTGAEDKKAARGYMIYGVIGIAVILAIFGLANFLLGLFGVSTGALKTTDVPTIPTV